jgi:hypothetical protein
MDPQLRYREDASDKDGVRTGQGRRNSTDVCHVMPLKSIRRELQAVECAGSRVKFRSQSDDGLGKKKLQRPAGAMPLRTTRSHVASEVHP